LKKVVFIKLLPYIVNMKKMLANQPVADCENLVQNNQIVENKTKMCPTKRPTTTENLLKQTSDIVFNNQTDKLLKKQTVNQSSSPVMGKYNLRKKSVQVKLDNVKKQPIDKHLRGLKDDDTKSKKRNPQLSRYKRKNANARERVRVKEINKAFEILKRKLPRDIFEEKSDDKLTKIVTLRNATRYIMSLTNLINGTSGNVDDKSEQKLIKMDALPDISFISSDELSSLSCISDEDNQLSNQSLNDDTFDCSNVSSTMTPTTMDHETLLNDSSSQLSSILDDLSSIENEMNNEVISETSNQFMNHLIDPQACRSNQLNQQLNNQQCSQVYNQVYPVVQNQPIINNNNNNQIVLTPQIRNQVQLSNQECNQINNQARCYQSTACKMTNDFIQHDSNNLPFMHKTVKNAMSFTPLLNNYDHNLMANTTSSYHHNQMKGDCNFISSYVSIKSPSSLTDDCLLSVLSEDNENDNFYSTFATSDHFDLIL